MALSASRTGRIFGKLIHIANAPLPADGVVYQGGVYAADANGRLIRPNVAAADNKQCCIALETVSNTGGLDDAKSASVMVNGVAVLPIGALTAADLFKTIYATDDDGVTLDDTNGRRIGVLIGFENGDAKIAVG